MDYTFDSPELARLYTILSPKGYLIWLSQWRKANPDGVRILFNKDYEEVPIDEFEDFVALINRTAVNVREELYKLKIEQISDDKILVSKYSEKLRDLIRIVSESDVMVRYLPALEKSLQRLAKLAKDDLAIDLELFEIHKTHSISNEKIQFTNQNKMPDMRSERGGKKIYIYRCDAKVAVRKHFAFLTPGPESPSNYTEDFKNLIQALDKMLAVQELTDPANDFSHLVNSEIKQARIIQAFGELLDEILYRKRPEWYVPSMISLFRMEGDPDGYNKKLKDDVRLLKKGD